MNDELTITLVEEILPLADDLKNMKDNLHLFSILFSFHIVLISVYILSSKVIAATFSCQVLSMC